jgi:ribonuclease III
MADSAAPAEKGADWPKGWLRESLGLDAADPALFRAALTHRSAEGENNERLEFLGDSVLNLVIAEHLYRLFPQADEGSLSRLRSRIVSSQPLAEVGAQHGVGEVLRLGSGELKTGGFRRESILADAIEALIGATYLDAGFAKARELTLWLFRGPLARVDLSVDLKDPKTRLQELLQGRGVPLPEYVLERTEGEAHEQTFWVRCAVTVPERPRVQLGGREIAGQVFEFTGCGSSRRKAEQQAAEGVLGALSGVPAGGQET